MQTHGLVARALAWSISWIVFMVLVKLILRSMIQHDGPISPYLWQALGLASLILAGVTLWWSAEGR